MNEVRTLGMPSVPRGPAQAAYVHAARRALIIVVLAALLVAALSSARTVRAQAPVAPTLAQMPQQLTSGAQVDAYFTKAHFQGYALLVRHGRTILSKGYGMAEAPQHVPITLQTQWPMFAIEGFRVAIAVLRLQEEGKLSVQDTLCTYVQGCPLAWHATTSRS